MQILHLSTLGLSYHPAAYYGWRHALHVGWWLVFWGKA